MDQPFALDLWLEPVGETFVFDSTSFLPLSDWATKIPRAFGPEIGKSYTFDFFERSATSLMEVPWQRHPGLQTSGPLAFRSPIQPAKEKKDGGADGLEEGPLVHLVDCPI